MRGVVPEGGGGAKSPEALRFAATSEFPTPEPEATGCGKVLLSIFP